MSSILVIALVMTVLVGCSSSETIKKEKTLKVGYIYINHPDESGWTYAHDQGRLYVEEETGVETMYIDWVPEAPESEDRMRELIDQGCNVIVATSFGYMDYVEKVAKEYPDVNFLHTGGYKTADNFGNYFGKMYLSRYQAGVIAATKSETGRLGYVAAFPYPEIIRGINGYTLGAKSVNPNIKVEVIWTNSWFDPGKETQAAKALIDKGADVLTQHLDSPATQIAAQDAGVFSCGYNRDMNDFAPEAHLISARWDWGPYIASQIEEMKAGTWTGSSYWGDDVVTVSELGKNAPEGSEELLKETRDKLYNTDFEVFKGPLKDHEGNLKVEDGVGMTDDELLNMEWFVEGVIPNL